MPRLFAYSLFSNEPINVRPSGISQPFLLQVQLHATLNLRHIYSHGGNVGHELCPTATSTNAGLSLVPMLPLFYELHEFCCH